MKSDKRTASTVQYKVIGTRPIRHDGADKVTGRAVYGADVQLTGMVHGRVLRSPHAHARIKSIDTSAAERLPGVVAVVTGADLPDLEGQDRRPGRRRGQSGRSGRQRAGARQGALQGARRRRGGRHQSARRRRGAQAHQGRVRAAAGGHLGARRDEGRRAALARRTCAPADGQEGRQAQQRRRALPLREGRRRRGLCRGRRRHRARVQDGQRPPGLHRAARCRRRCGTTTAT